MSVLGKAFLGPARTIECKSCKARLGTPWRALWTAVPFVLVLIIAMSILGPDGYLALLVLAPLNTYVWYRYVPLERRDAPAPGRGERSRPSRN